MHAINSSSSPSAVTPPARKPAAVGAPTMATEIRRWLAQALLHSDSGHLVHRLDAVLLVASGRACAEVGTWFGIDKRTVQRWVQQARTRGCPGLTEHHAGGRQRQLNAGQLQQVALWLQAPPLALGYPEPRWSGKRLALHIHHTFGVSISTRSGQRLVACAGKRVP